MMSVMKSISERGRDEMDKYMKKIQPFADFKGEMTELEERYHTFLDSLPANLAESGNTQFYERARRRENNPCIVFYIPFWFAELFGIEDEDATKEIAMGNFYLYHYVTLKDDALDKKTVNTKPYLQLSDILLKKALGIYFQFAHKNRVLLSFKNLVYQWDQAEAYLIRHQDRTLPYTPKDFEMMGKKAAMIKMCLPMFYEKQDSHILLNVEKATDLAASGLQLMDDFLDWREDFEGGLYTYPLWLATSSHRQVVQNNNGYKQPNLAEILYLGGVAEHILEKSNNYLYLSEDIFANLDGGYWVNFLDFTIRQNSSLVDTIQSKRQTSKHEQSPELVAELEQLIKKIQQT
jgi:hypothetical protein